MFKLEDCWLPDNHHIFSLKNAHILASVYGDIGTERGVVRLESISFFDKKTDEAYDIPVDGTVSDISGRNGIKGIPTLRNKAVLLSAGLAGGLSGLGGAVSQLGTSQSIGGGGVTNAYNPSRVGYSMAGGAVQKSADNISNYLVKLAEAYSPVIEIRPGSVVNIIFQHGFPYRDKEAIKKYSEAMNLSRVQENQSKNPSTAQMISGALAQGADVSNQQQNPNMDSPVAKAAIKSVKTQTALSSTQETGNPFGS
jgi:conjugal transfer pilus assembly protein TraB